MTRCNNTLFDVLKYFDTFHVFPKHRAGTLDRYSLGCYTFNNTVKGEYEGMQFGRERWNVFFVLSIFDVTPYIVPNIIFHFADSLICCTAESSSDHQQKRPHQQKIQEVRHHQEPDHRELEQEQCRAQEGNHHEECTRQELDDQEERHQLLVIMFLVVVILGVMLIDFLEHQQWHLWEMD